MLQGLVMLCWGGFIVLLSSTTSPDRRRLTVFWSMAGSGYARAGIPAHPWLLHGLWGCCLLTLAVLLAERRCCRRQEDTGRVHLTILLLILIASLLFYYLG
ncbi:hypothetical protein H2136_05605 [Aeromonas hydrophila]|uniref:Uncharacterized protein n=1 Tax=Aeromonas hydrophila TaxID=644 RepID=A0A926FNM7_AERHY|nr:hypothetical protein [Aeromonas hydrophila]